MFFSENVMKIFKEMEDNFRRFHEHLQKIRGKLQEIY